MSRWTRLTRTTPPSGDIVSLAEAKAHLRVDAADEDAVITDAMAAAMESLDGPSGLGRALLTQKWRLSLDAWESPWIELLLGPVQSIDQITYVDPTGTAQTLDPATYVLDSDSTPARLLPAPNVCWPALRCQVNAVKIGFTCGYGAPTDVPRRIKSALKLLIADLYTNRDGTVIDASRVTVVDNPAFERLLRPYRIELVA